MTNKELIKQIEEKRGSKVLCYINSDRGSIPPNIQIPGLGTQIASEPQLIIYDHLKSIGKVKNIDLFLYSRGGDMNSVWPLVSLIREYCDKFSVLVPFRAHSAATMIALGANEIIMTEVGELSPIDPTTSNQFNPRLNPADTKSPQLGISVEDVVSYIKLAKEGEPKLKEEQSVLEIFKQLTNVVHPLALGNVNRVYTQIRQLATKLLEIHMKRTDSKKISEIVEYLTEKFYSHMHAINRVEAKKLLGSMLKEDTTTQDLIWQLFRNFSDRLQLQTPFNIKGFLGQEGERELEIEGAFIESADLMHAYKTKLKISQRSVVPPNLQIQIPAGQPIPALIPGLPTSINVDILAMQWEKI